MTVETYTVYPTNKNNRSSPPLVIPLHGLDLIGAPMDIHNHRFYHSPTNPLSHITDKLRFSLAEALELYPLVAGTVQADKKGELFISTEAVGAPFLVQVKDRPYDGDSEDLSPRNIFPLPLSSPSLAVKVTQFSCGTIVVATSIHHSVTDLCGYLDFLKLWAKLARGEAIDYARIPNDWSHNPGRFFVGVSKSKATAPPPPFIVLPVPATGPPPFLLATSEISRWKFTKSSIKKLKQDLSPSASEQWISSGDALVALLSGVITRARKNGNVKRLEGRSSLESQTEAISMAADGRERAPEGNMTDGQYFGNFNTLLSATVSRSDLLSLNCESASRVALAIRDTLNLELSPEAVASKISFFEDPKNTKPLGRISWSADVIFTNWCKFDLKSEAYDFSWGKPFLATDGAGSSFPPGYCLITQEKDSGDIFVLMTVEREAADKLKNDSMLNTYAVLEPSS